MLSGKNLDFVQSAFRSYYSSSLPLPSEFRSREFGFGFEKKIEFRHKAFSSEVIFKDFLVSRTPLFVSYSSAYYDNPSAQSMASKGFLGADLIFDIDPKTDHEGHNPVFCPKCVSWSQEHLFRLVENFLVPDFGFSKKDFFVNFSGSKGFHLHAFSEEAKKISKSGRRILCNYVVGSDISFETLFTESRIEGKTSRLYDGPSSSSLGWKKKVFDYCHSFVSLASEDDFHSAGLTKKASQELFSKKEFLLKKMAEGRWHSLPESAPLWASLVPKAIEAKRAEIDSAVTFDSSRLIRLENSLHGSTGLVAKTFDLASLDSLDASEYCVAFRKGEATVLPTESVSFSIGGQTHFLSAGNRQELPLSAAVLAVCKGVADIP